MKIFVTGGTGFLGTHFLGSPQANYHQVIALRRSESGSTCLPLCKQPNWLTIALDQVTPEQLFGCDAVVHFASPGVSPKVAGWEELLYWNVVATMRLMRVAREAGVRRFVVAGTCAEYGRSADRFDPIPPDAPLEPTSAYAASKAAAFVALYGYAVEQAMELIYPRVFSAFGDGQYESNFWPSLKKAALEGRDFAMTPGEQVRDYLSVEEVATVFWRAVTSAIVQPGQPYVVNVGSGNPVTMRNFAEAWWSKLQAKGNLKVGAIPYRKNEVMRFVPLVSPI